MPAPAPAPPPPPPHSAFHKALALIADNIGKISEPDGEIIGFLMCTFNRAGVGNPAANGPEAAWLRAALGVGATAAIDLRTIARKDADTFRADMLRTYPTVPNPSALMAKVNNDADLLDIHAAASAVWTAIH